MPKQIFADPTFEPPPTREQRRLALIDPTRPVDAPVMDIGPDTSNPLGRVLNAAFEALAEDREFMPTREVIRLATQQLGGVA